MRIVCSYTIFFVLVVLFDCSNKLIAVEFAEGSGFRINGGELIYFSGSNGKDIVARNNSNSDIWVPNNSALETESFVSNAPVGIDGCEFDTWKDWTEPSWSTCTSCSQSGTQTRSRECLHHFPQCEGVNCPDFDLDESRTKTRSCGTTNGGWSNWVRYDTYIDPMCQAIACPCTSYFSRSCINPTPACGGTQCSGPSTTTAQGIPYCPTSP